MSSTLLNLFPSRVKSFLLIIFSQPVSLFFEFLAPTCFIPPLLLSCIFILSSSSVPRLPHFPLISTSFLSPPSRPSVSSHLRVSSKIFALSRLIFNAGSKHAKKFKPRGLGVRVHKTGLFSDSDSLHISCSHSLYAAKLKEFISVTLEIV